MVVNDSADQQINKKFTPSGYVQIYQPQETLNTGSYKAFIQLVEGVAKETRTPFIFRVYYTGFSHDDSGNVNWFKPIANITFFQTDFTAIDREAFIDHGTNTVFENQKLSNLSFEQYKNSSIYLQSSNKNNALSELANKLSQQYGITIQSKSLTAMPNWYYSVNTITHGNVLLIFFVIVSFIFYLLFLFVWLVENNQNIAIYRLNGFSSIKIANRIFIYDFLISVSLSFLFATSFIIRGLSFSYFIQVIGLSILTLGITYLAILFVSKRSLVNQVNHKPFLKNGHRILYAVKVYIFAVSVATSMGLITLFNQGLELGVKSPVQNYGVLYTRITGYTINSQEPPNNASLFQYTMAYGGLHIVKVPSFLQGSLGNLNDLQVNANYLKKVHLLDVNNKIIHIDNNVENGVVLINEKLKSDLPEIERQYNTIMKGVGYFKNPKIDFYLIKDKQQIPLYDASNPFIVTNGQGNNIIPDIIEVYTSNNAGSSFITSVFDSNNPYGMMIPIIGSKEATYKSLLPAIKEDANDSIYPSFISVSEIPQVNALYLIGSPYEWVFTNFFAFALFLLMITATTSLHFKVYKKKIAVNRLQGASWWRTYRWLFALIFGQYVIYFGYSIYAGNSWMIFEIFAFYLLLEMAIVVGMLRRLEKKSLLNVLKGE